MHLECWKKLVFLEYRGKLTRMYTKWPYHQIVNWCRDSFDDMRNLQGDDYVVTWIRHDILKSFVVEFEDGERVRAEYDFGGPRPMAFCEQYLMGRGSSSSFNMVWFKDPERAMLFKLAQD